MTSEELNRRIQAVCDDTSITFETFGGKAVPYIGWFWRSVDFDCEDGYDFGIIPPCPGVKHKNIWLEKPSVRPFVGFMENNKWDYEYIHANREQWHEIKNLLIEAVQDPCEQKLKTANDAIQALYPAHQEKSI